VSAAKVVIVKSPNVSSLFGLLLAASKRGYRSNGR
jgi:hypothetical protein